MTEKFELDDGYLSWACSQFGEVDALGWRWVLQLESGWEDTPPVQSSNTSKSRQDGSDDAPPRYGERTIALTGTATAARSCDAAPAAAVKRRMKGMLAQGERLGVLTGHTDVVQTANVRLGDKIEFVDVPDGEQATTAFTWKLTLSAADALLYGPSDSVRAELPYLGHGIATPIASPIDAGLATPGGLLEVPNGGYIEYLSDSIRVQAASASVTNVRLVNPTTGETLTSDPGFVLLPGQWVTINCRDHTVYLNDSAAVSGRWTCLDDRWLPVRPGGAVFGFFAESTDASSYCEFTYADANV